MNSIEGLIERLCPDGVEYKALGDVGVFLRGTSFQKKHFVDEGIPCVHYGQLYTYYRLCAYETKSFLGEDFANAKGLARPGDLIIATTSENEEDVCKAMAWLGATNVVVSNDAYIYRHTLNPKYVAYFFQSSLFQDAKKQYITGTKVLRVSGANMAKINIPVPPMEVQEEIVRVLDSFAELEAELEARKRQYAYYSKKLIERHLGCTMVALGDLGKWSSGKTPSLSEPRFWDGGYIPWISSKDMKRPCLDDTQDHITDFAVSNAGMKLLPEGSIATVTRSGILKHTFPIAYLRAPMTVNQDIKALVPAEEHCGRYIALVMQAYAEDIRVKTKKQGGTVDSLDFAKVKKYKIPVPSHKQQVLLAEQLEQFSTFVNDISQGLPAEIEARRKQYAYYRDKLLSFKEKVA